MIFLLQGTITPEGNASIHCYACDDGVLDLDLPNHLLTFGVKVDQLKKTEKTIMEMVLSFSI
jgi:ubiquitin carboxyl-terminal hydrolase 5/13